MQEKKITLKIHKKSRFQPNEKIFAESCSVLYKDLLRAKKIFGVIGTLTIDYNMLFSIAEALRILFRSKVRWYSGFHSRGETAMLVHETMAKCRLSFA